MITLIKIFFRVTNYSCIIYSGTKAYTQNIFSFNKKSVIEIPQKFILKNIVE
jgi:hypothetical protein